MQFENDYNEFLKKKKTPESSLFTPFIQSTER